MERGFLPPPPRPIERGPEEELTRDMRDVYPCHAQSVPQGVESTATFGDPNAGDLVVDVLIADMDSALPTYRLCRLNPRLSDLHEGKLEDGDVEASNCVQDGCFHAILMAARRQPGLPSSSGE